MNVEEVAHGPALVPPTGANEMDLHELVTHIERDHTMRTRGYVVKANGWVDPSTLANHRYVVLTIEHRSESGALLDTYFIRIDRRAERHLSAFKFIRRLGKAKSSDRAVLSYDQDRLLVASKKKQVESALRLDQPLRLDRLGLMLGVVRVEFAHYKLTKENCWAMKSVILGLLEAHGRGTYLHGKLCFPGWAPEVRGRVQSRFTSALLRANPPAELETTDDPDPRIEELTTLDQSHPPPPTHLFGRDDYVGRIMEVMRPKALSGVGARLVIGGPGGIGKTSVALAVLHSPELDGYIPRTRRFFVPCQSITTASTFVSAIASSLGLKISQGDALSLVIQKLKAESAPLMLVLDNAESFWFDYEIQPHSRTILRHVCSVHTVTLLLTIRGTERPNVTAWDPLPLLGPLSPPHARQAFLAIATDLVADASLDHLLKMVDYVPLAVSLLARRCQIMGESAMTLCDQWEKQHTELLKLGGREPDDNIDISIKLSLDSPLMQSHHDALRLLSVVSYLPAGISDEACSSMSLSDVQLSAAEFILRRLSLTYSPTSGWITVLEPIRAYMRRHNSPMPNDKSTVEDWHVSLANTHGNYRPGHDEFRTASGKLAANSTNITFVLRAHIQQREDLAVIAVPVLAFSCFLYWMRPNGDLLQMLLSAGMDKFDHSTKGQCLWRLGEILRVQMRHEEARLRLDEARSEFIFSGNQLGAAQCLQSLSDIFQMEDQYGEARLKLEEALSEFILIGNQLGATQCLHSLGNVFQIQDQREEARSKLEARSEFIVLGNWLGAAQCLQSLSDISGMQGQYQETQSKLEETQSEFINIGSQLGIVQCLQGLGNVLRVQGQYEEARFKLEEAHTGFTSFGDRLGAAQCLQGLGNILQGQDLYEAARSKLEEARSEFVDMGDRLGAAQCLQNLGEIPQVHLRHEDAQLKLEEAWSEFAAIDNPYGAARCQQSLGEILRKRGDYTEARSKLEGAWSEFTRLGLQQDADECRRSLDNIAEVQDQQGGC